jgi:hypothetical protein
VIKWLHRAGTVISAVPNPRGAFGPLKLLREEFDLR